MSTLSERQRAESRQEEVAKYLDDSSNLEHLAALQPIEYDRRREEEAKRLGIRVGTLDQEVAKLRDAADEAASGKPAIFKTIEPWPDPVDGAELLDRLADSARRYMALPDYADVTLPLWAVFTHVIDAAHTAPILAVTAPEKRCGKTTVLQWLRPLVARSLAASNITAAALFRAVEKWSPTLLIDEADTFLAKSDELRGIINSGHTRGQAFVIRTVGDDHEPERFSTWAAKVIAMIGSLPETIADRSIHIEMRRKLPHERIESMRDASRHFDTLAQQIARWAQDSIGAITAARPILPPSLHDRAADNWHTLIAIADAAGGHWPNRARQAAVALSGQQDDQSANAELLADIREIFERRGIDRISTAELIEALVQDDEAPWATWNRGKPITGRQIAKRLREFRITPNQTIRIGTITAKGYRLDALTEAFERYLKGEKSVTRLQPSNDAGSRGFESVTQLTAVTVGNGQKPSSSAACNRVTDVTGTTGRSEEF